MAPIFPVTPGNPDYSSNGTIGFIPAIWSSKILKNYYDSTCFNEICNTDYEG